MNRIESDVFPVVHPIEIEISNSGSSLRFGIFETNILQILGIPFLICVKLFPVLLT